MKRVETNKFRAPANRRRRPRFSDNDNYHWSRDVQSRSTTASNRERTAHEIQPVDRNQSQHQHRSTSSSSRNESSGRCHSSSSASGSGDTRRNLKVEYTTTKVSGLRYKFHSDKSGKIKEKPEVEDEKDEIKYRKKSETSGSKDLKPSLPPQNKRKNLEPEDLERNKRQAVVAKEVVNPKPAEIQESSRDDCYLAKPPDIQTRKVDEPEDDDDEEEDLDILIIDLSDKEREEMESWAK